MRTRIDYQYKSLKQFLEMVNNIKPSEDVTELYLSMSNCYLSPTKCASDISTILNKYAESKFILTIDFSGYFYPFEDNNIETIANAIASCLARGKYPNELTINFKNPKINKSCVSTFANAIASGNCCRPFTLGLMYTSDFAMDALIKAIRSGKCPRGLHLDISGSTIGYQDMLKLSLALEDRNCPEDLHISLIYCGTAAANFLSLTLESGKCPKGLMLTLKNGDSDATILSKAFNSGKIPPNVTLEFYELTNKGAESMAIELEKAFKENKLPSGFKIIFQSSTITKQIENRIKAVLMKNNAKHTALACIAFQRGQAQNHPISLLPDDMISQICSQTFFATMHPFFQGRQSEEIIKKEKAFTKNLDKQFSLKRPG